MKKLEVAKLILNISVRARTCGRRVEDRAGFSRYVPLAAAPRHACRACFTSPLFVRPSYSLPS